jgi:hypothetical protein
MEMKAMLYAFFTMALDEGSLDTLPRGKDRW